MEADMITKQKSAQPQELVLRDAKETSALEQYWHLAERPKLRKPPKKYKYVEELAHLQFELIKLQEWVRLHNLKLVVLFEGRDAAGKGGVIKRITQSLNPRNCRVVALGTPTERQRGQWYFQRYVAELPAPGEIVLFDRSWYNRTDRKRTPWYVVDADNKKLARLNCISHLLRQIPYDDMRPVEIEVPPRQEDTGYKRPKKSTQRFVPKVYA